MDLCTDGKDFFSPGVLEQNCLKLDSFNAVFFVCFFFSSLKKRAFLELKDQAQMFIKDSELTGIFST